MYRPSPFASLCRTLFLLCAAWPLALFAQQASGLPEPLQGIPRAGESCRNASSPVAQGVAARAAMQPDTSCSIALADVREKIASSAVTVVDTRALTEFQRFHINGSMRLQPRDLLHKPALRNKALLLVGSGKGERELYAGCALLRQSGFSSVRVLAGGMISYVAGGGPFNGNAPSLQAMATLDAAQLWAEAQFGENLVVVASGTPGYTDYLPYAVVLPGVASTALTPLLDRHRKETRKPVLAVVLAAPPTTEAAYRQLAASIAPVPLLTYGDSPAALQSHMASQKAIWAAHARGPRQPRCG